MREGGREREQGREGGRGRKREKGMEGGVKQRKVGVGEGSETVGMKR